MFGRRKDDFESTVDLLIVYDDEQKTSDIQNITDIRDDAVIVNGKYSVPYDDCVITNSREGRHFFYRAPSQSIVETRRLAALEQNIVLRHLTHYKKEKEGGIDFMKVGLLIVIIVAFIVFGAVSCSIGGPK